MSFGAVSAPQQLAEYPVPSRSVALLPLDAKPLGEQVTDDTGALHEVIGWLDIPPSSYEMQPGTGLESLLLRPYVENRPPTRVAICRDGPGKKAKSTKVTFIEFQNDQQVGMRTITGEPDDSPKAGSRLENSDFSYSVGVARRPDRGKGPALVFDFTGHLPVNASSGYNTRPKITAAADTPVETPNGSMYTFLHNANRGKRVAERIKGTVKLAVGIVAVYAVLASGGLIDRGTEGFNDAGQSVHSRLAAPEIRDYWLDAAGTNTDNARANYPQCVDRVAQTMEDLDNRDHAAIDARAAEFRRQHANELMTQDQIDVYRNRLDQAETQDKALSILNEFMHFYGKNATFLQEDAAIDSGGQTGTFYKYDAQKNDVTQVKWMANKFINAFSYLPKTFVEAGKFEEVTLAGGISDSAKGGLYTGKSLLFPLMGTAEQLKRTAFNASPDFLSDPQYLEHGILHEFAHSLDRSMGLTYTGEKDGDGITKYMLSRIIQMPNAQSGYAAAGPVIEQRAENFSGALELDDNGLADPNNLRNFISDANTAKLRVMAAMEARYPGFTDYIASLRLNKQSAFYVPLVPFVHS